MPLWYLRKRPGGEFGWLGLNPPGSPRINLVGRKTTLKQPPLAVDESRSNSRPPELLTVTRQRVTNGVWCEWAEAKLDVILP